MHTLCGGLHSIRQLCRTGDTLYKKIIFQGGKKHEEKIIKRFIVHSYGRYDGSWMRQRKQRQWKC